MKKCHLFLVPVGFLLFMLVAGIQSAYAQSGKPADNAAPKVAVPVPVPVVPFCDEAIPKAKAQLQTEADAKCRTMQSCVHCVERESKTELYATLYVQPLKLSCKTVSNLQVASSESARQQAINFEIAQAVCTRSGVSLEVNLPDPGARSSDFTYEWTVDGKPAGREAKLECACGKTASIRVTHKNTKQSTVKTMTLPDVCLPDAKVRE